MLRRFKLTDRRLVETDDPSAEVLCYVNPTDDERAYLIEQLAIDEHTLSSSLDPDELGRVEFEPQHLAMIVKRPQNYKARDDFVFKVTSMGMFLFPERLVLVQPEDVPLFDTVKQGANLEGVTDIMLRLVSRSTSHFLEHLRIITMIADSVQQKMSQSSDDSHMVRLFGLEKSLIYYTGAAQSNRGVIERLRGSGQRLSLSTEQLELLDDIAIENRQCAQQAETSSRILARLMDARLSILSNRLTVMMKDMNAIMIALAAVGFFAGVGGMSEFSMMVGGTRWPIAYGGFMTAMALLGFGTYKWMKKERS